MKSPGGLLVVGLIWGAVGVGGQSRSAAQQPEVPAQPKTAGSDAGSQPPAASTPNATPPAEPDRMPRGPSIYETGRVGQMGVSDSGVKIKHTQDGARPKEQRVQGEPEAASRPGTPARGVFNQAVLARELRPRLALLRDCRVEVARQKHLPAREVPAGSLTLRWIILPTGQVTETEVVAMSPVDGHVIDCVKRQMSLWSFTAPTGGPARLERPFKFQ